MVTLVKEYYFLFHFSFDVEEVFVVLVYIYPQGVIGFTCNCCVYWRVWMFSMGFFYLEDSWPIQRFTEFTSHLWLTNPGRSTVPKTTDNYAEHTLNHFIIWSLNQLVFFFVLLFRTTTLHFLWAVTFSDLRLLLSWHG